MKNILKKAGCKAYHNFKTQNMSNQHKINRVSSAEKLLRQYAAQYRTWRSWSRLVNTDFYAKIKICPTRNSKNDIIWSTFREAAGDLLESNEEKFSLGKMIWGGVCSSVQKVDFIDSKLVGSSHPETGITDHQRWRLICNLNILKRYYCKHYVFFYLWNFKNICFVIIDRF